MKTIKVKGTHEILQVNEKVPRKTHWIALYQIPLGAIEQGGILSAGCFAVSNDQIFLPDEVRTKGLQIVYTEIKMKIIKR